ncbi:MAG TPA: hypothetical protein VF534_27395 [Paraburkholderia sp.]
MAENYAKLWVQKSANKLAINRAQQAIQNTGRALPCRVVKVSGAIVTVAFEVQDSPQALPNITIPKAESPWVRMPTQVGDKGVTMPADVYLGGVSGLGGGVATMTRRGNLSALVFVPVSSASSGPIDPNAAQVQGPDGVILQTTAGTTSSIVTNQNGTTITFGTTTFTVNASGITMTVAGQTFVFNATTATSTLPIHAPEVILPNGAVNTHYHGGVQTGLGSTGTMTG